MVPILLTLLLAGITPEASAQTRAQSDAGPEEPGVDVPPVIFEYDAPAQRDIDALMPEAAPLELPEIEAPMPEPERMELSSLKLPISPPQLIEGGADGESSFFSEGRIGLGTGNHLLGDLSLYKRGEGPHFSVGFSHEGTDGYARESSGTGYFHRKEKLEGGLSAEYERNRLDLRADYIEQEKGLQDFGRASSVIHRFTSADAGFGFGLSERFTLETAGDFRYASQTLAGRQGSEESYSSPIDDLFLRPEGYLVYSEDWGEVSLGGGYEYYRAADEESSRLIEGSLELRLLLAAADLSGEVGALYDEELGVLVPFRLQVEGMASDLFHYSLGGGYAAERRSYGELWLEYPLLDTAKSLPLSHGPRLDAGVDGSLGQRVDWSLAVEYFDAKNLLEPLSLEARDSEDGLFSVASEERRRLDASARLGYTPLDFLNISLDWKGEMFGETVEPEGRHRIRAKAELEEARGRYGGSFGAAYRLDPNSKLPIFDSEAFYRISEGVRVRIEWSDMLGLLVEDGRRSWGEYLEPGMQLRIMTEISL